MEQKQSIEINLSHIEEKLVLYIDAKNSTDLEEDITNQYTNEAQYQLKEGRFYDYEFSDKNYRLKCSDQENIVQKRKRNEHEGRISPNIFVGTLSLEIFNKNEPEKKWEQKLEVQSTKTSYRKDYQYMLNSITEKCTDLILQANSPVSHSFETDFNADNETLYQRFAFVKSIINSEEFEDAVQRIVSSPTTKWFEEAEQTDVRKIKRFRNNEIKQLINANNRIKLSENHPLHSKLASVATKINSYKKKESVDTSENRFIKHALEIFSKFCMDIGNHPNAGERLQYEANEVTEKLENHLQHNIFKEIARPTTLKLNSPTLQKKEGYREILKVWLKFDLAAKLVWDGGEDVYSGGKKDIATLYEYWLFFKLLDVLKSIFDIEPKELEKLITPSANQLSLQLKQGKFTALQGTYTKGNRDLNIRFNYNRSFKGDYNNEKRDITKAGSWTTTLRPDYTLSIWPTNLNETQAEEKEQIVHIHFDAKYKIANINQILENKQDDELNDEKKDNLKGIYKNADLLKMHAYKDAIRRTSGAYVLYPGDTNKKIKGFHEILPGLGAFSIKPTKDENINETIHLESFLQEILEHFLNNASQRENIATKAYNIHKNDTPNTVNEPIPEFINGEKLIPDETYVLVGFSKDNKKLKWYKEHGLYNFRMNDEKGSLVFKSEVVNAKYLLIRESGKSTASQIFKIKQGVRVFSKEKLQELNHPSVNKDHYLVIDFEKDNNSINEFENVQWNFKDLKDYQNTIEGKNIRIAAGLPFTTTLTKLMSVIKKD